jgi:hypothetical protein
MRKAREDGVKRINPLAGNQEGKGLMACAIGQLLDNNPALGHEKASPPHQVAFPNVAINLDARIVEVVDLNQFRHALASPALWAQQNEPR